MRWLRDRGLRTTRVAAVRAGLLLVAVRAHGVRCRLPVEQLIFVPRRAAQSETSGGSLGHPKGPPKVPQSHFAVSCPAMDETDCGRRRKPMAGNRSIRARTHGRER